MELTKIYNIVQDEELEAVLEQVFEIIFQEEQEEPWDEDGHMEYSMPGKVFATNGGGGSYLLLEDGSIGYHSGHGQMGRIAENVEEFLELIINCPYWEDYTEEEEYQLIEQLQCFVKSRLDEFTENMAQDGIDVIEEQKRVAKQLDIKLYENIAKDILMRLYITSRRTPTYDGIYTEEDGERHAVGGCVFTKE